MRTRRGLAQLIGAALALSLGGAVVPAVVPTASASVPTGGDVVPLPPARLMDTRDEPGAATIDGAFQGGGAKPDGTSTPLDVTDRGGVPPDAIAVFLNVTAVAPSAAGYLTLHPCDTERPVASNVNFAPGDVVANMVLAKVAPDGTVCVFNRGATQIVIDVNGYVPAGGGFVALAPQRFFESRDGAQFVTLDHQYEGGGRLAAGSETPVKIGYRGGIPTNITSVMLNITAVDPSAGGHVTVYPCDTERPVASNLNYAPGDVVANAVFARVNTSSNEVCIATHAETDLIVDVTGYVAAGVQSVDAHAPRRLLDTRDGPTYVTVDHLFEGDGPLAAGAELELRVHDRGSGDAPAVFLNVTAVAPDAPGHLTVYPCGTERPLASNLNYTAGAVVPNAVLAKVGVGGKVCIYSKATTHLVVDVNGYALAPSAPPPTTICSIDGADVATSIPQAQCDALVALYNSTAGAGWETSTGWLTATDPCTWHGVWCGVGGVEELNFYDNDLAGPLPPEIGNLVDLVDLKLWVNQITEVPPEIGNLTSLRTLWLSNNAFVGVPAEIWSLTELQQLELAYSGISSLPPEIGDLTHLQYLDVSGNDLIALPSELTTLSELRSLDLSYNEIAALPPGFGGLAVERLDLGNNPALGMPAALAAITTMTTLTHLELFGLGIATLPDAIGNLVNLIYLSVGANDLVTLPASLYTLPLLEQLDISHNELTGLAPELADLPKLTYLTARYNLWSENLNPALQGLMDAGLMQYLYIGPTACTITGAALQAWVESFDPSWNDGCP
jgi:Leucine-rich repeat (LRR) protein